MFREGDALQAVKAAVAARVAAARHRPLICNNDSQGFEHREEFMVRCFLVSTSFACGSCAELSASKQALFAKVRTIPGPIFS